MIVYKDYLVFKILGEEVVLISDETCYGRNTVAEINNHYYYLADEYPTVSSAIFTWQEENDKDFSEEELHQIMIDNKLISGAQ